MLSTTCLTDFGMLSSGLWHFSSGLEHAIPDSSMIFFQMTPEPPVALWPLWRNAWRCQQLSLPSTNLSPVVRAHSSILISPLSPETPNCTGVHGVSSSVFWHTTTTIPHLCGKLEFSSGHGQFMSVSIFWAYMDMRLGHFGPSVIFGGFLVGFNIKNQK